MEIVIDRRRTSGSSLQRSGPGGQSVNTTDSAVRITHLPTGLVVEIQDENAASTRTRRRRWRSSAPASSTRSARSSATRTRRCGARSLGSGDRADKIRTYNYPQDRVTDHRIGMDLSNLPGVLDGNLDRLIDALAETDQAEKLRGLTEEDGSA